MDTDMDIPPLINRTSGNRIFKLFGRERYSNLKLHNLF